MTDNYILDIDSSARDSGTDGDFTINIDGLAGYTKVSVLAITFSRSYYNVQEPFNSFTIGGYTITVPEKSYSATLFCNTVKALLNDVGTLGAWTYTLDYYTGHITFETDYIGELTITLPADDLLARMFGLPIGNTTFTSTLESTYVVDFNRTGALYLSSSLVNSKNRNGILYTIHPGNISFTRITSINPSPKETMLKLNTTLNQNSFRFTLFDDNMNKVNLNGNQMIITLLFSGSGGSGGSEGSV